MTVKSGLGDQDANFLFRHCLNLTTEDTEEHRGSTVGLHIAGKSEI